MGRDLLREHEGDSSRSVPQLPEGSQLVRNTWSSQPERGTRGLSPYDLPPHLLRIIRKEDKQIGLRIFLLDNSGSTQTYDGKYLQRVNGEVVSVPCTRWEEIKLMALDH